MSNKGKRGGVYPYSPPDAERGEVVPAVPRARQTWRVWLIPTIVVANIVVFLVTMYRNNCPKNTPGHCIATWLHKFSFQEWNTNPLLGPTGETLLKVGGLSWNHVVERHQWWRLFSSNWLHAGLFHVLANMAGLVVIGHGWEKEFGFIRVGIIYLLSGLGGSVLSLLFNRTMVGVGASGAVFGVLGSLLSELITNWSIYSSRCAAVISLLITLGVNLAIGLMPYVDNFAHIGGFLAGFLLGFVLLMKPHFGWVKLQHMPPRDRVAVSKYKPYQYVLWVAAAILLVAGYAVGFILLFRRVDGNEKCSWCHYLTCVPSSHWTCQEYGKA